VKRVLAHHHVVRGLYQHQGRETKLSIEHEHLADVDVPHFHSGDESTGGACTGPSMREAPQPSELEEGPARVRLWAPRR
jgi:hypothetical protein